MGGFVWIRSPKAVLLVLAVATVIHLDWHLARPTDHHLSLGLPFHWLLAVPLAALLAGYVHRAWPARQILAAAWVVGLGAFVAGVVEPAWELWTGAPFDWAFGPRRLAAFGSFVGAAAVTVALVLVLLGGRSARERPRP